MATLSSASTQAQIEAEYDDNASYAEDNSPAKAKRFVTACRLWIRRAPVSAAKGDESLSLPVAEISEQLKRAEAWLTLNPDSSAGGSNVRHLGFREFRGL